jgi:hypothetical protein
VMRQERCEGLGDEMRKERGEELGNGVIKR